MGADAGVLPAYLPDAPEQFALAACLALDVGLRLVEGLATAAKQPAGEADPKAIPADQFRCYLAPDFFRIWMSKYSSALSIIMSRALVSSSEKARAFSSSLMRLL